MCKCYHFLLVIAGAVLLLCSCSTWQADQRGWCSQPNTAANDSHVWKVRSCKVCQSVQGIEALSPPIHSHTEFGWIVGKEWKWQYKGRYCQTCEHEWQRGVSRAVPSRISNGQVVLVRKENLYGAFVLTTQSMKPETAQFIWRYGIDRDGTFNTRSSSVKWSNDPKQIENRQGELMIEFGPFEILWSGTGWVYYSRSPGDKMVRGDLAICVTDERSLDNIRPLDKKWQYRRSPVDKL